jgi:hypothetical protein
MMLSFPFSAALLPVVMSVALQQALGTVKAQQRSGKEWAHQDLNLKPPDYESGALTD